MLCVYSKDKLTSILKLTSGSVACRPSSGRQARRKNSKESQKYSNLFMSLEADVQNNYLLHTLIQIYLMKSDF